MTVENISHSISMKVWSQAEIELMTPGSAIRLATYCATRPGCTLLILLRMSSQHFSKDNILNYMRLFAVTHMENVQNNKT